MGPNQDRRRERFVRWQGVLRDHFGCAINLFLTFSTASLGYGLSLFRGEHPLVGASPRALLVIGCLFLGASILNGCGCVLNRLRDFRETVKKVNPKVSEEESLSSEDLVEIGRLSWNLFYCEIGFFLIGILLVASAVICA